MEEIYRDTQTVISLGLVGASAPTNYATIQAYITKAGADVVQLSADNDVNQQVTLPFSVIGYDGKFNVRWDFTYGGEQHSRYESHEVVTPLVDVSTLTTQAQKDSERVVRRLIQNYTGQNFGYFKGTVPVRGSGQTYLDLPQRLMRFSTITNAAFPSDAILLSNLTIVRDGWMLSVAGADYYGIKEAPPESNFEYQSGVNGVIYTPRSVRTWQENRTYLIAGDWGYEGIPRDVTEAANILMSDYADLESTYRDKYLESMTSDNWTIEYNPQTWQGTGNVRADLLLEPYRRSFLAVL